MRDIKVWPSLRSLFALIFCISTLSGCATARQAAFNKDINSEYQAYWRPILQADTELTALRSKLYIASSYEIPARTPFEYFNSNAFPTEKEKQALRRYYGYLVGWFTIFRKTYKRHSNRYYNDIIDSSIAALETLAIKLATGRLNYGDYHFARQDVADKANSAVATRNQQMYAQQARAYQNYLLNQQLINSMNQPTQIAPFTCRWINNRMYACQ